VTAPAVSARTNSRFSMQIDNRSVTAAPGDTILDVARAHDVYIPTLCFMTGLSAAAACRLCLVEVHGIPRLLPACATAAAEGMKIVTDSPRLRSHRRTTLEMLFIERNHVCATCVSNGRCELQSLAQSLGMTHVRFPYRYQPYEVDASHPRFVHDANRCVLCTRCVRVCEEIEGARTWSVKGRGIRSELATDLDTPWGGSDTCTSCGKCVHVCPTGALFEKGAATGEMVKRSDILPHLTSMRAVGR